MRQEGAEKVGTHSAASFHRTCPPPNPKTGGDHQPLPNDLDVSSGKLSWQGLDLERGMRNLRQHCSPARSQTRPFLASRPKWATRAAP
jgi:hypothetical protein